MRSPAEAGENRKTLRMEGVDTVRIQTGYFKSKSTLCDLQPPLVRELTFGHSLLRIQWIGRMRFNAYIKSQVYYDKQRRYIKIS